MTLALRLLLAFGLLTVAATGLVGIGVREEWRHTEEQRFSAQLAAATAGVLSEVRWEASNLRDLLRPVCEHDAFIDQTLLDLERRELDTGRRLALTQLVPEEMKALHLDELVLFTGTGEVLGAGHDPAAAGKTDRSLLADLSATPNYLTVRLAGARPSGPAVSTSAGSHGGSAAPALSAGPAVPPAHSGAEAVPHGRVGWGAEVPGTAGRGVTGSVRPEPGEAVGANQGAAVGAELGTAARTEPDTVAGTASWGTGRQGGSVTPSGRAPEVGTGVGGGGATGAAGRRGARRGAKGRAETAARARVEAAAAAGSSLEATSRAVAMNPGAAGVAATMGEGSFQTGPSALVTRCIKRRGEHAVELIGARHLAPMLDRIGSAYGVRLSIDDGTRPASDPNEESATVSAPGPELEGLRMVASISRKPLEQNLASLDERILVTSGAAMAVAIALAILLARSLAGPIEALARQAREVVHGDPRPVQATGGRELEEFARAYNRAIEDLFALRVQLARTERIAARREVARQVAHEIKNPLAPIRAAVETLRRLRARNDPAFDEYFDEATRTVLEEVFRISRIVTEFTDFARLPAPTPGPVQLEELARNLVSLYAAGGADITLEAQPCPTVQADRDQIVQVLTNLVKNGLEAAEGGAEPPRIAIRLEPADAGYVSITVSDNGPGVDPELLPKLYEPYATTKPKGTGLGLAIVRRIIEEHGGEIRYEGPHGFSSDENEDGADETESGTELRGAAFRILLPVAGPGRFDRSSERSVVSDSRAR